MEAGLVVYPLPSDPRSPQVCMDEMPRQLLKDVRDPLPMEPGQVARIDDECEREGVGNGCLFGEPLQAKRWVSVTEQRTKADWAEPIRALVDGRYPDAERIRL